METSRRHRLIPPMGHLTFDRMGWVIFQMKNLTDLEWKQHSCGVISLIITPVFSLAKSLQLILKKQHNLQISYLLAVNWLICRLYAQCMISKSHVKQCSAWLFLWCYWTSKQCIVKCNVTLHGRGIHHWLVFNKRLKETLLESTKNGCQCIVKCNVTLHGRGIHHWLVFNKRLKETLLESTKNGCQNTTKYWENLRNFLLSCMSPCSRPLLACLLPTGLLSIWQVSFQTDLPSKKIYYFVDYCTALFFEPCYSC